MDVSKTYSFDLEQDAPIERKKKFVSIRSQVRGMAGGSASGDGSSYSIGKRDG